MQQFKDTELIFATHIDSRSKKVSSYEGNSAVMVLHVEDADRFIEHNRKRSHKKLAILARKKVSREFAEEYIDALYEYKVPFNKGWYYLSRVKPLVNHLNEGTGYTPKVYSPKIPTTWEKKTITL